MKLTADLLLSYLNHPTPQLIRQVEGAEDEQEDAPPFYVVVFCVNNEPGTPKLLCGHENLLRYAKSVRQIKGPPTGCKLVTFPSSVEAFEYLREGIDFGVRIPA